MNTILFFAVLLSTTYLPPCMSECPEGCRKEPENVTFSFRESIHNFVENLENATIFVDKINGSTDPAITLLVFGFMQGELIKQEITFDPNDSINAINFKIPDDDIALEPIEEFELFLYSIDGLFEPNNKTTIKIMDDDELLIGLAQNVTVMEGNNAILCVNFSSKFETNFKINVENLLSNFTLDNPAIPGEDFDLSNFSIEAISTQYGPNNSKCFKIYIFEDEFVEHEECFEVGISLPYSVSNHLMVEISEDTAVVCIKDNDRVVIGFEEPEIQVSENITDGVKLLCVKVFEGELMYEARVKVQYYNQTADAVEDYKEEIINFTFSQNDTRVCFNVSIIDDNIHEHDEVLFINIATSDPQVTLSPNLTILTIKSDDVVNIVFIDDPFVGREVDDGFIAITVGVMEPEKLKTEVSVHLTTEDIVGISNAATSGVDYRPLDETLVFNEIVTVITVNVTLLDDNALEGDEDFKAQLFTNLGSNVGLGSDAILTIVDDDSKAPLV